MEIFRLPQLSCGSSGIILSVEPSGISQRLADLGFTQGAKVRCLFAAPSGEPKAYGIRGTVIALRKSDAAAVKVALWKGGDENGQ